MFPLPSLDALEAYEGMRVRLPQDLVISEYFKSGTDCGAVGDRDVGDGQGGCKVTRTQAAQALADYLATDPTSSGDPDRLITGDLNS